MIGIFMARFAVVVCLLVVAVAAQAPDSRPVSGDVAKTESRPASRPLPVDVPEGSTDPLVDGMRSIVTEMKLRGLKVEDVDMIGDRIRIVLEKANVGDDVRRRIEASALARQLLEIQKDYRPKNEPVRDRPRDAAEESVIRTVAEFLARDLYRRLPVSGTPGSSHTGTMRATVDVKPPEGYSALTWKTIGGFEYTEGMKLPDDVKALHGKKVAIAGYMMALDEVENIREFLLVESLWSCCFGTPPTVNQVLVIRIEGKKGIDYTSGPIQVAGILDVGEKVEDGFVTSVYRLKADKVLPAE